MKNRIMMIAASNFATFLVMVAQYGIGTNSWGVFYAPEIPATLRK
ncbi:MAG TPA: hypothetical protein DD791_05560 [Syntrophomonas sp.]|jgi:cyclic lactone autoinducer peptide|nr:hypothetical protein [Syntrophomonas sp.]